MVNASFTADAILDDITGTGRTHFFLLDALLQASGQNGRCSSVLQAYYKFTQTSGNLLVDSLSAISDADSTSISNMNQSSTGIIGNGYRSSSTLAASIIIGGDKEDWNFLGRSDWTANFWINSDEGGGFNTDLFSTTISDNEGVVITYNSNNAPQLKMGVTIFDDNAVVFGGSADTGYIIKNDQTWHMYTIVIREGIGIEFYRDAVLHTSTVNTNTFNIESTDRTPRFFDSGAEANPDVNYDEFSFFDGALTSTQISQLYNSGSGFEITQPFLDGLIGNQQGCVEIDAVLKSFGANGSCPAGGEAITTVLDNIDLFDTQVNVSPNLTKTGQRWTPTVGEVALLQKGISKVNLWHGHTGGQGQFRTFVWQNATAGTSSETIIRDGGTFFFFGASSGIAKRLRILFDAGAVNPQIWLPTAGVEYVIGVEDDFPGTAQTRKTGTDTINGVFTQRTSAGVWTDTVGQDWALQFTIEQSGLGQGGQNLCLGVDGRLRLIQLQQFTVDAILVTPVVTNTQNFLIDGLLAIMPSRMTCVDAVLKALGQNGTCGVNSFTGLKAYYTFNGTAPTFINETGILIGSTPDTLGTAGDVTAGSLGWLDGQVGQVGTSWDFTNQGQGQYGNGDSNTFSFMSRPIGHTWTWNTWIKPDATSGVDALAGDRNSGGANNGFSLVGTNDGTELRIQYTSRAGTSDVFSDTVPVGKGIPIDGSFHMLTMTYDQSLTSNNWKVYNDGILVHQGTRLLATTNGSSNVTMFFARSAQIVNPFNGFIDETSIWDRVWTTEEIQNVFFQNSQGQPLAIQTSGVSCFAVDALLDVVAIETKDFTVDALIQVLGENGQCPIPATETFYSRAKSVALAERLGEGVNSPFANISRSGVKILGSTHAGKAIEDIRVLGLLRNGVGATGTILATVRSQNDTVITSSTNSVLAESLPTSGAGNDITFTFDKKVVLQDGYKILLEFPNCIGCADSASSPNVFWFGTSTASPAGTSRVAFGKSDTVNPGAYTTETTTGFTQGGTISFTTSAAEPAEQRGCAEVDALLKATQTEDFTVDAQLLQLIVVQTKDFTVDAVLVNRFDEDFTIDSIMVNRFDEDFTVDGRIVFRIDKNFIVDAKLNRQVQFIVDVSVAQDTGVLRDVGDLILRVLFENQDLGGSGLTGREIVDEIVAITTVELQWGFRGKTSRIKNWIGFLKRTGVIQEDNSDPDWYETVWTLVVFPP